LGLKIEVQEFDSRRELEIFLFTTAFRPALNPTQPPIQWELGALYLVVKRQERKAKHSSPFSAKVKNA
jgi:tRNA U34 5-methylaminomethyl-2-thiouridine-forming methyltransferase MnmC